ncbi:MAG: DNA-binding protein WhiA [Oscillospiraceae bacterium]|nr:DNA-binding protein WhiA [Oscillospiraceae bacterium]
MSFAAEVKAELCRHHMNKKCCTAAEIYGILLYCNTFSSDEIRIVTESRMFAQRVEKLFRRAFGWDFDQHLGFETEEGKVILAITEPEKIAEVFDRFGNERERIVAHHINLGVLESECCRTAFVRGAFLAGGSVTDPRKNYHLELITGHFNVSNEVVSMLFEMGFSARNSRRSGNCVTYLKQSEAIEDLLTTLGAPVSAMEIMNAKVEKDMRNSINRKVNCDTANVEKTVNAAMAQIEAIRSLAESGALDGLGEKFKETARLRVENPEASIAELASMCEPPVTKSCLNHRLRKIIELAK